MVEVESQAKVAKAGTRWWFTNAIAKILRGITDCR
jgi:hypothetical protein